jgi:hypothetical protein
MPDSPPHTDLHAPHGPEDLYVNPPPWDIDRPQPAFLALAEVGAIRGRVLQQSGDGWPRVHRVTQADISAAFAAGWRIDGPATIEITTDPDGIRAWLLSATRM